MSFKDFYIQEKNLASLPIYKGKNTWIDVDKTNRDIIRRNLFLLISRAFVKALGEKHFRIMKPNDVTGDSQLTFWQAVDVDKDPLADAVIFGQKRNGFKISGFGHDGTKPSIDSMMNHLVELLNSSNGIWIEASGATERVLRKRGAKPLDDKSKIEKLFGQKVQWGDLPDNSKVQSNPGNGWYKRVVNLSTGEESNEVVFGTPRV